MHRTIRTIAIVFIPIMLFFAVKNADYNIEYIAETPKIKVIAEKDFPCKMVVTVTKENGDIELEEFIVHRSTCFRGGKHWNGIVKNLDIQGYDWDGIGGIPNNEERIKLNSAKNY